MVIDQGPKQANRSTALQSKEDAKFDKLIERGEKSDPKYVF